MKLTCLYQDLEYKSDEKINKETQNYLSGIKTDFNDIIRLLRKDNIGTYIEYLEEKHNQFEFYKKKIENEGFIVENNATGILKLKKVCYVISEQMNSTNEEKINIESGLLNKYAQYRNNKQLEEEIKLEVNIDVKENVDLIIQTKNFKLVFNKKFDLLLCFKDAELIEINPLNKKTLDLKINNYLESKEKFENLKSSKIKKAP